MFVLYVVKPQPLAQMCLMLLIHVQTVGFIYFSNTKGN